LALVHDGHAEKLNNLCKDMIEQGSPVTLFEYEGENPRSAQDIVSAVVNQNTSINTLIICVEEPIQGDLDDIADLPSVVDSLMNANYYSAVYFTNFAIPHLRKVRGKIVVLVGSDPATPLLSATRGALNG
jgi:NAD(P)-dependent dehydrogenase (short-subunit alcohol dehydrogenase family)